MPNAGQKQLSYKKAEVLGLYGQNGSGKTAVIDALDILQRVMIGFTLESEIAGYIGVDCRQSEIGADFNIFSEETIYEVHYDVLLQKNEKGVEISRETLSCSVNEGESRSNKTVFMDYQRLESGSVFSPAKRFAEVAEADKENRIDLIVARKIAEKSNCSYIFGESSREIFSRNYENNFRHCSNVIRSLFNFAMKDLFVISNMHSGMISANVFLPLAFKKEREGGGMKLKVYNYGIQRNY